MECKKYFYLQESVNKCYNKCIIEKSRKIRSDKIGSEVKSEYVINLIQRIYQK